MTLRDILENMREAFGSGAELRIDPSGSGEIRGESEYVYFNSISDLEDLLDERL